MGLMFTDRVVVVTGGSSGLGKALSARIAGRGGRVALVARDRAKLEAARQELAARSPSARVESYSCDVTDVPALTSTLAQIEGDLGPIWMTIASAGILHEGPFGSLPLDVFRRTMEVNFFGAVNLAKAALPHLEKARGHLVNVSSVAGLMGVYGYSAYCSSKFALVGLSETLRAELQPLGIRVHLVCPPEFDSPMVEALETYRTKENAAVVKSIPVMTVDAVADATLAGIERGDFLVLTGVRTRMTATLARLFPGASRRIADARVRSVRGK